MKISGHKIDTATFSPSPNCDNRPDADDISLLVIHCISLPPEQFGGPYIGQLFRNELEPDGHPYFRGIYQLRVSAHLLIRRDGGLMQFVPFNRRAWHAGVSQFQGRERCNDFSIGIELEGSINKAYTPEQYRVLADVSLLLLDAYTKLDPHRIVGHSDIAQGRKEDPGPWFDWPRYLSALAKR